MFKKRFYSLLLMLTMIFIISSCDTKNEDTEATTHTTTTTEINDNIDQNEVMAKLGVTHVGGKYNFSEIKADGKPFLQEGAEVIRNELGAKNIKLWLSVDYAAVYNFNHVWDDLELNSITDLAKHDYFKTVFNMDFDTIALEMHGLTGTLWSDDDNMSDQDKIDVYDETYELATYLLTEYKDTNKTFIIQNWEGDNMIKEPDYAGSEASDAKIQALTDWFNVRSDAIKAAREDVTDTNAKVYHCIEINKISSAWTGPQLLYTVIPNTDADLYSYSNWETAEDKQYLKDNLDEYAEYAPDSETFGSKNIMLGEFGSGEIRDGGDTRHYNIIKNQLEGALEWGVQYAFVWEIYCNSWKVPDVGLRPQNNDLNGFWLIRPDGTYTTAWWYLKGLLEGNDYLSNIPDDTKTVPPQPPVPEELEYDRSKEVFRDNLTSLDNMSDYSEDGLYLFEISSDQYSYFEPFLLYNGEQLDEDWNCLNRIEDVISYIEYEKKADNMIVYGFSYGGMMRSKLRIEVSKDNGDSFVKVPYSNIETPQGAWSGNKISISFEDEVTHVRITFISRGANFWDPILREVIFLDD